MPDPREELEIEGIISKVIGHHVQGNPKAIAQELVAELHHASFEIHRPHRTTDADLVHGMGRDRRSEVTAAIVFFVIILLVLLILPK